MAFAGSVGASHWGDEKVFSRRVLFSARSCYADFIMPRITGPSPQPSPKGRGSQFGLSAQPGARPRFREGEAPAEPRWPLPARTAPRPPKFGGPGFGRAKLLLSRGGLRRLGQSLTLPNPPAEVPGGRSSC